MPVLERKNSKTFSDAGQQSPSPEVLAHVDALVTSATIEREHRGAWGQLIDDKLIEWGRNPDLFGDEEIVGPTRIAIAEASRLAAWMRDAGMKYPSGVIPDGEGGIVFENRQGATYERFEILDDGAVFYAVFEDCKLVARDEITIS